MANPFDTNQSLSRIGRSEMMSVIDDREDVFPAIILGHTFVPYGEGTITRYHWREIPFRPEGQWHNEFTGQAEMETLTYRKGNAIDCPAYETNGREVPDNAIVWMRRGHLHVKSSDPEDPVTGDSHGQEFLFDWPEAGAITVQDTSGNPPVLNVFTLEVGPDDAWTITEPVGGTAQIVLNPVSGTNQGIVTADTQTLQHLGNRRKIVHFAFIVDTDTFDGVASYSEFTPLTGLHVLDYSSYAAGNGGVFLRAGENSITDMDAEIGSASASEGAIGGRGLAVHGHIFCGHTGTVFKAAKDPQKIRSSLVDTEFFSIQWYASGGGLSGGCLIEVKDESAANGGTGVTMRLLFDHNGTMYLVKAAGGGSPSYGIGGAKGATGTFLSADTPGKTVTVTGGIITNIV